MTPRPPFYPCYASIYELNEISDTGRYMFMMWRIGKNKPWILQKLGERGADWMIFNGWTGQVYASGEDKDYPDADTLIAIQTATPAVIFVPTRYIFETKGYMWPE